MRISPTSRVTTFSLVLLVACHLLLVSGCENPRKQQIASEVASLNSDSDRVKRALSDQESTLEALNQRLRIQNSQLDEYTASVKGYMLDHKMAVAAVALGLAGGGVALDDTNAFSEDAKEIGAITAVAVAIWVIGNMDEVSDVVKTLNLADAHVRSLKAGIAETSLAIQRQQTAVTSNLTQIELIAQKVSALRQEASAL